MPFLHKIMYISTPLGLIQISEIALGLCNRPNIFQEKMNELFDGLDYVRTYITDD